MQSLSTGPDSNTVILV